ncbi:MAG: hypothetical protein H7838_01555 [Magnetococcus sp. DMHC-8]
MLTCMLPVIAQAGDGISFIAHSQVTAQPNRLSGQTTLTLQSEESIGPAQVLVYGPGAEPQLLQQLPGWQPRQQQTISFDLPIPHPWPGWYHLLLEVRFQDKAGGQLNAALGVAYSFGTAVRSRVMPPVLLRDQRVEWPANPIPHLTLRTTTGPHWRLPHAPLTPADQRLPLQPLSTDPLPLLGWSHAQVAVLDWVEEGFHQSRIFEWRIQTDRFSPTWRAMQDGPASPPDNPPTVVPEWSWWSAVSCPGMIPAFLLGVAVTLLMAFFFSRRPHHSGADSHPP